MTVTGQDRPGVAATLFDALGSVDATVTDIGQITIRGHLVLCVELDCPASVTPAHVRRTVLSSDLGGDDRLSVERRRGDRGAHRRARPPAPRDAHVAARSPRRPSPASSPRSTTSGGTCERIVRLATYPVQSYELVVLGADHERLRSSLATESARLGIDLAVQRAGLHRRAKRLVVLDADSTLLKDEVIDLLAVEAGRADEVAAITEEAMAGGLDFRDALARRVAAARGALRRRRSARSPEASSSRPGRGPSCGRFGGSASRRPS